MAAGAGILTVALVVQILTLREVRTARERGRERFLAQWRPLVYEAMAGEEVAWPPVARGDVETLLGFWNQLHESVRGDAKPLLNRTAAQIGIDRMALHRLAGRNIARRLLGIVTLGNMRDPKYWHTLVPFTNDPHPPVSLAAAQALIRINGQRAVRDLMPLFAQRTDWPVTRALALLGQVEPAIVTQAIARALPQSDEAAALRLIEFVAAADPVALQPDLVQRLRRSRDPQMRANVLKHLNDPSHLALVRQSAEHKIWFVRVQAVNALGRIGGPEDVDRLIALLRDPEWWVRYRAAEALLKLPFLGHDELRTRAGAAGHEAVEMLDKVAAKEHAPATVPGDRP